MKKILTTGLVIVTLAFVLAAGFVYRSLYSPLAIDGDGYLFEFNRGDSTGHLASALKNDGVINSSLVFKLYVKVKRAENNLKAGEYFLKQGDSLVDLIELLKQGSTLQRSFTFVEGWTVKELLEALEMEEKLNWENNEASVSKLKSEIELINDNIEGMFFADTYHYSKGQNASELLVTSNLILHSVLIEEWQTRNENLPLDNPYEALILASIVEKETGLASERPLIAGVFINRLNKKMRLQTDPTVIYGLGDQYQGNLTKKHLQEYTPYNTYRISGLPPTPIAIVGRESIHAVLNPEETDFLYFVAKGDGSHYFSATLEEHQKAVKEYQWKRVENYRSAPESGQK